MESRPGEQLPHIPGIKTDELMERVGDDPELFWEVLGEFSTAYRETPAELAAALEQDPVAARQLAHTLKGVLGNLAATELFAACAALHEAIRDGRPDRYPEFLPVLSRGIPALCDAIAAARSGSAAADRKPSAAPEWLREHYAVLRIALEDHRARDCKNLAETIADAGIPETERPFFDELHALIRGYRFKEALEQLASRLDG
jgi:two-component system, sensor histidine kinase and response regulator